MLYHREAKYYALSRLLHYLVRVLVRFVSRGGRQ